MSSTTLNNLFSNLNFIYHAPGDAQETKLPSESIDIIFSYGVLEPIPNECS